jgi:hypothetical protein
MVKKTAGCLLFSLILSNIAYAAHPLITDDTGTQGTGTMQFEFIGEYGTDEEYGVAERGYEAPTVPVFSYGITDAVDLILGLPSVSLTTEDAGETTALRGIGDAAIEVKSRFYDKDSLSLALKPGISLPTGDENKGLGNGKISYSTVLIAGKKAEPWAFHFNVGYALNHYKLQADRDANRKHLWHVSAASQLEIVKDLSLVANIGMERNSDRTSNTSPAFALAGFIFSITENLEVDMGIKVGLNKPETDVTYLAGIVWRL